MSTVGSSRRWRTPVLALTAVYLLALAVVVLGPWGWSLNRITVWLYVQFRYVWPLAPDGALPEHYGLILNAVMFAPLGAALMVLTDRPWWWVSVVAAAVSGGIEFTQWLWLAREAQLSDLVANTLGAAAGALVVSALRRVPRREADPSASVRPQ